MARRFVSRYTLCATILLFCTSALVFSKRQPSVTAQAQAITQTQVTEQTMKTAQAQAITQTQVTEQTTKAAQPQAITQKYPGDFAPDLVVHLYPEGQHVDRGIAEAAQSVNNQNLSSQRNKTGSRAKDKKKSARPVPVTLGPGEANRTDTTEFYWERDGSLNAVSDSARILLYFPRQLGFSQKPGSITTPTPTGQLILVCPGGGYNEIMLRSEGIYAAKSLTARGFAVGIICYRMPTGNGDIPLTDVQNAFRYCRHHAAEWGITQIGIMGMSAGGHLAAMASTRYIDAVTRPDFTILFYPVVSADPGLIHRGSFRRLTGLDSDQIKEASEELGRIGTAPLTAAPEQTTPAGAQKGTSPEQTTPAGATDKTSPQQTPGLTPAGEALLRYAPDRHVTPDTPPALIFHSIDDGVNPENSLRYYERLTAQKVPAELHIFPTGGHGWGFNTLENAGRDKLEPYRPVFFDAITGFLRNLPAPTK